MLLIKIINFNLPLASIKGDERFKLAGDSANALIVNYPEFKEEILGEWKMVDRNKSEKIYSLQSTGKKKLFYDAKHYEFE